MESQKPLTLAVRMQEWRERRMLTQAALAQRASIPLRFIEDIEAGIELFLPIIIRQRLARILHIHPRQIQELERPPKQPRNLALQAQGGSLLQAILDNPDATHRCPACGGSLNVRFFKRFDLQNRPLTVVKASCNQCLFRLTDD
jgi:DNA-binding XRE family transcriptional regulator